MGKYTKLDPRYYGLFELLAEIVLVAYHLSLTSKIKVDDVFHVSLLKKYMHDPTHFLDWNMI